MGPLLAAGCSLDLHCASLSWVYRPSVEITALSNEPGVGWRGNSPNSTQLSEERRRTTHLTCSFQDWDSASCIFLSLKLKGQFCFLAQCSSAFNTRNFKREKKLPLYFSIFSVVLPSLIKSKLIHEFSICQ